MGKMLASRGLVAYISRIGIIDGYYQFRLFVGNRWWRVRANTQIGYRTCKLIVDNMKHLVAAIVTLPTDDHINFDPITRKTNDFRSLSLLLFPILRHKRSIKIVSKQFNLH